MVLKINEHSSFDRSCVLYLEREREGQEKTGYDRLATEVSNAGHMHEGAADSLLT